MTRVLVTLTPQMYREAIALAIHRDRPDCEVKLTAPEMAETEVERFHPHLVIHNDTAPIPEGVLGSVRYRVQVLYSDSMDARFEVDGVADDISDASVDDLLGIVDRAAALARHQRPR